MQFAIEIVPFGELGEPRSVMRMAQAAEAAGWDGLFVWDHLAYVFGFPGGDAWVLLSAAAAVTQRIRLGTNVTPLPRYRPQALAQTLVSLDLLSQGRLIFGAGLGGTSEEFRMFGEPDDARQRAAMLDEGLQILDRLLRGETVTHQGRYYSVQGATLLPRPVQQPRPPVWIGGESRAAQRRAARWAGWIVPGIDIERKIIRPPEQMAQELAYIQAQREQPGPLAAAVSGCSEPGPSILAQEYAGAGATWWLESLFGLRGTLDEMVARVEAGPPGF